MKSKRLAQWLENHADLLGQIKDEQDKIFHEFLYEGIIAMAAHGERRMVDSVLESAAAHAVAVGRELTDLLGVPQRLRERIWRRIGDEVDPEPAFVMLTALDRIFVRIARITIDAYEEGNKLAHGAKAAEISRLYTESEQKVMEYATEVSRANRELAQLEQAKTDFISIAAHELKTPLTLIQGYANILRDMKAEEPVLSLAEGINRGTERMNSIIENMLDLSAIDMKRLTLVLQKVTLSRTLELIFAQLKPTLTEREQRIETVGLEALPAIEADPNRMHQIFKQIIHNAIKYTPDGGQITITGELLPATPPRPAEIRITIEDTGVGIAPEDRIKVFEKFYRVGDSSLHSTSETRFMGAGPGLGLAIVKGMVEAHGGRVRVESAGFDMQNFPGSIFTVTLPVQARPRSDITIKRIMTDQEPGLQAPAEPRPISETEAEESN